MKNSHAPEAAVCPSAEDLLRFGQGDLTDPAFETVADHLSQCGSCLAIVADLHARSTGDFLAERVRDCLVAPELRSLFTHADVAAVSTVSTVGTAATGAPESDPWVGQMVGRYHIRNRLGAGGMGVVYLAEDPAVGRAVALKKIQTDDIAKPGRLTRFQAEGRALACVRHVNVVEFFHFDEYAGHPYYTMEFVDGNSLASRLPKNPLPVREAAKLVRTVAAAVNAIHQKGLIHRDIKPSNILIAADGTPKVADFGLAKLADAAGQSERTQTGMVLGTPSYMSPEQAEGRIKDIDARSDVYALGAVLYAAITGNPPHRGPSTRDTLKLVSNEAPIPPSHLRPDVPKVLDRICAKCLEKSPGRRYATAAALADDLDDYLAGRAPRSLPGPVGRALQPTLKQALIAAFCMIGIVVGFIAYGNSPGAIRRGIAADLRNGKSVTLIGEKGKPKWFEWVVGEKKGNLGLSSDGTFSVHVGDDVGLIELVPDPQTDSYRFTAKVRHDSTLLRGMSDIGLYVARKKEDAGPGTVDFFLQLSFNDIRTQADFPTIIVDGKPVPQPVNGFVRLGPRLFAELGSPVRVDHNMEGPEGPAFLPVGELGGRWRTMEVTVTPDSVDLVWDGQHVSMSAIAIQKSVARNRTAARNNPAANPVIQELLPTYTPRGGVGLFVSWGTASFRDVSLTPLLQPKEN